MIGSLDSPPIVIRSGRGKTLAALLGCLAFIGAASWTVQNPSARSLWRDWLAIIIFGLLAIAALWRLILPATLTVSKDGLSYTGFVRNTAVHWREIVTFTYRGWTWGSTGYRIGLRPPTVTIEFAAFNNPKQLPLGWELDSEPLCALLNQALARCGVTK